MRNNRYNKTLLRAKNNNIQMQGLKHFSRPHLFFFGDSPLTLKGALYGSQAKRTNMVDPPFIHLSYLAVLICAWAAFFHPPGCPPPWLCCTFHFDKLLFTYVYFNDSFHSSFFLVWCSFLAKHAFGVALCVGRFHPSGSVRFLFFFSRPMFSIRQFIVFWVKQFT